MRIVSCKMAAHALTNPELEKLGIETEDDKTWIDAAIDLDSVIYAYKDRFIDEEGEFVTVVFIGGNSIVIDATLSEFMQEWGDV
jgi:hypothetical protein